MSEKERIKGIEAEARLKAALEAFARYAAPGSFYPTGGFIHELRELLKWKTNRWRLAARKESEPETRDE